MLEQEDLKLICPVCQEVSEKPPLEEWQMRALMLLIKQHSPLLELSLHVSEGFLMCWEDITLDAVTANSLLILSDD